MRDNTSTPSRPAGKSRRLFSSLASMALSATLALACIGCTSSQPSAESSQEAPANNDIVVVFTGDVHCAIDENIGYAGVAAYEQQVAEHAGHVFLVDCGDFLQGGVAGSVSEGGSIIEIMNAVGYDFVTLGNHEFDYGVDRLSELIAASDAQFLSSNISYNGSGENPLSEVAPYSIVQCGDASIAFIGVTTPETTSDVAPATFKEGDEYVYDFAADEDGAGIAAAVQQSVDECRAEGADYVVVLSHLGDGSDGSQYSTAKLAQSTQGIDAILDGHSHNTIPCQTEQGLDGQQVVISAAGEKIEQIGQLVITEDGLVTATVVSGYTGSDAATAAVVDDVKNSYEAELAQVAGTSEFALAQTSESGASLVRMMEMPLGNFCADAYRACTQADIACINGGGIRASLPAGDITYSDLLSVHPFGNEICMVEATGQEILDMLEVTSAEVSYITAEEAEAAAASAQGSDGEDAGTYLGSGSLQQVSGLRYTINTNIESPVNFDDNGVAVAIEGERRVRNVEVLDENGEYQALDPSESYTIASTNYLIEEGGCSFPGFQDNEILQRGDIDYEVLARYLTEFLEGVMPSEYEQAQGRITIL